MILPVKKGFFYAPFSAPEREFVVARFLNSFN